MSNQAGLLDITELQGKLSTERCVAARHAGRPHRQSTHRVLIPRLNHVEIGTILKAFTVRLA